jgi:hypothetical protein
MDSRRTTEASSLVISSWACTRVAIMVMRQSTFSSRVGLSEDIFREEATIRNNGEGSFFEVVRELSLLQ